MIIIQYKLLRKTSKPPFIAHSKEDAAFDLYADEACTLYSGTVEVIKTGVAIAVPTGYFGLILGRSSLAGAGISVLGGVIDSGFRGEWRVNLLALSGPFPVHVGDRIAQCVVLPVPELNFCSVSDLPPSARGEKGYGSSGR